MALGQLGSHLRIGRNDINTHHVDLIFQMQLSPHLSSLYLMHPVGVDSKDIRFIGEPTGQLDVHSGQPWREHKLPFFSIRLIVEVVKHDH